MSIDATINLFGIVATIFSVVAIAIVTASLKSAFKNQQRITALESRPKVNYENRIATLEAKPKIDYENRITTLEANADNHADMIREHRQESKEFRKALEQNTIAISELTTLITLIKNKL